MTPTSQQTIDATKAAGIAYSYLAAFVNAGTHVADETQARADLREFVRVNYLPSEYPSLEVMDRAWAVIRTLLF